MSVREGDPHGWQERLRRHAGREAVADWKARRAELVTVEVFVKRLTAKGAQLEHRSPLDGLRSTVPDAWFSRDAIRCADVNLVEGQVVTLQIAAGALIDKFWPVPADRRPA